MKRSLKFALRFANTGKIAELNRLWETYRDAVNFFIEDEEITSEAEWRDCTLNLGTCFKQAALRQAKGLLRASQNDRFPFLTRTSMILDNRFIKIVKGDNSFDYWIRISTLDKGHPVRIPIKSYDHANKYFRRWNLVNGGRLLRADDGNWFVQLTFQKKKPIKKVSKAKGLDIGYRKLITDSDGYYYGTRIKALTEKAARKQQGSKADGRVRAEIKNYIGQTVHQVVDGEANIAIEDLKRLKDGKSGKWSKRINRQFRYWFYALTLKRIQECAEVIGVQCRQVPPQYTSQTCPSCGHVERANRQGERFRCLRCGFCGDADHTAARNILHLAFAPEFP